jgi:hypothetical protein
MQLEGVQEGSSVESRADLVERIAKRVVAARLETPAVLWLEMNRPLAFLASQAVLVGLPILGLVVRPDDIAAFSDLLKEPEGVESLIRRIEELSLERSGRG